VTTLFIHDCECPRFSSIDPDLLAPGIINIPDSINVETTDTFAAKVKATPNFPLYWTLHVKSSAS
tara:strand:- start:3834 stop:4028 length:195 start_codon:yes stop_codon:yes gene_type:complete